MNNVQNKGVFDKWSEAERKIYICLFKIYKYLQQKHLAQNINRLDNNKEGNKMEWTKQEKGGTFVLWKCVLIW